MILQNRTFPRQVNVNKHPGTKVYKISFPSNFAFAELINMIIFTRLLYLRYPEAGRERTPIVVLLLKRVGLTVYPFVFISQPEKNTIKVVCFPVNFYKNVFNSLIVI